MIIVDKHLEERERQDEPIRVGLIGAGFMARGIALQILSAVPGMDVVAIANRSADKARSAYAQAGVESACEVSSVEELENAIDRRQYAVTTDAMLLCQAEGIDAVVEVTGAVEFGARVALEAFRHRKHLIQMNAELNATVGPILKVYADEAGVVATDSDGDQPGVIMNLFRFVKGLGVRPVLCGNIKGLQDPYRNPTTQAGFAQRWKVAVNMVTSFADGTKISFEQCLVANATGMRVAKRGMWGPTVEPGTPIQEATSVYPVDALLDGPGVVDYVVGAAPAPGVFVLGAHDDPVQRHYLNYYKLGDGPLYCFYSPYHLCHFETPSTIARAVLFGDATIAPRGRPTVDVVATAKRDLKAGETLDGIGRYMTYGQCENAEVAAEENLLPMGLAEGCRLNKDVPRDRVLNYGDVDLPIGRLCDELRAEQDAYFFGARSAAFSHPVVHGERSARNPQMQPQR